MARKLKPDVWLFTATLVLLAIGVVAVYSASSEGVPTNQFMWVALGAVAFFATMHIDYKRYAHPSVLPVLIGLTLAGLVAVFFFPAVNHSHRWIKLGTLGTLQPSELGKLVVILFAATAIGRKLEANEAVEPAFARTLLLVSVLALLVYKEPDGGGAIMLVGIMAAMMFVSGLPYRWVGIAALAAPILAALLVWDERYRLDRWEAFLNPESDPLGAGYQPLQSLIAVGTGGWWGKGYMAGVQRLGYLPEARNDYIYAVIAEDKGLIGATFVLLCFAVLVWRGLKVARAAPDAFGSLLAFGITAYLGLQAMFNMSVVLKLVPAKGIPLPFVSAGGSSMLVSLVAMGVLLNISQQASATDS
ncbi:MAG: cell division protein FtsW [Acidobacteria bacterium]|nr:MAG: cell division protein FtsW [Acidobacteriota bacterium]RPJ77362.1 MAG: cell division protein FtsW [Acidobacteriota bacterium]